ncbi:MAG: LPS export ABC transporter periplasmic protein LptC [Candidatus Eisenbacteria bacterium]|nr:LPS export ABC transporter periplasmic protein LptC [Candidatus Eisenbacteria bacterium]
MALERDEPGTLEASETRGAAAARAPRRSARTARGAVRGAAPAGGLRSPALGGAVAGQAPQWKLYARYSATYNARNVVVARGVRVDFYDDRGQQSSELTAREGEIQLRSHNMTARGNVVLQTREGTRMSTEEIHFLNREQKIISPVEQLVRVERGGDVLKGYGFESDPGLKRFEFKKNVSAVVHTQSGGGALKREGERR